MMSAKFWDFLPTHPFVCIWQLVFLYYKIHATFLTSSAFRGPHSVQTSFKYGLRAKSHNLITFENMIYFDQGPIREKTVCYNFHYIKIPPAPFLRCYQDKPPGAICCTLGLPRAASLLSQACTRQAIATIDGARGLVWLAP